jgi:NAD(P)-dependent dehydrogenase (short-subunit alcohol dehydrogenase family)
MNVTGTLAFITGGSRGLGVSRALQCTKNGAPVALCYRQRKAEKGGVVTEIEKPGRTC